MERIKFELAQLEIESAMYRYQHLHGSFDGLLADIKLIYGWLPQCRIKRWLENWLASVGESEQLRYDKLATYWAGLWAAAQIDWDRE